MLLSLLLCDAAFGTSTNPRPAAASSSTANKVDVRCDTTAGSFTISVYPNWAPLGAQRFLELVDSKFYRDMAVFRVVPNFLVQFGISGDPRVQSQWTNKPIQDDPNDPNTGVQYPIFKKGMMAFAGSAPNSRTTQVFVSYSDSNYLGREPWGTPFAQVTDGMDIVDSFYNGYGDISEIGGKGPSSAQLQFQGNAYLSGWPRLDYILSCQRVPAPTVRPQQQPQVQAPQPTATPQLYTVTSDSCREVGCGVYALYANSNTVKCSCDWTCEVQSNCCPDFALACPDLSTFGKSTVQKGTVYTQQLLAAGGM